jgi:hypothetical protein
VSAEKRERLGLDALEATEYELVQTYDYFNAEQILRKILPAGVEAGPGTLRSAHTITTKRLSRSRVC